MWPRNVLRGKGVFTITIKTPKYFIIPGIYGEYHKLVLLKLGVVNILQEFHS